jgi:hypothetical protein
VLGDHGISDSGAGWFKIEGAYDLAGCLGWWQGGRYEVGEVDSGRGYDDLPEEGVFSGEGDEEAEGVAIREVVGDQVFTQAVRDYGQNISLCVV